MARSHAPAAWRSARILLLTAFILLSVAAAPTARAQNAQNPSAGLGRPEVIPLIGPVSQDRDLRDLPDIPATPNTNPRLTRHPRSGSRGAASESAASHPALTTPAMPSPLLSFDGVSEVEGGCGCLPPDTDGDVGPSHFIQAVNTSIKIYDKTGNVLQTAKSYNSFFSALGPSTPCGSSQNRGDGIVFYDHLADRWFVSDMAWPTFPGTSFYQCFGVSKGSDPVSGGWWLYTMQVDPSNDANLGDYAKFSLWPDAYYMTVNLFADVVTFNGVRVFALDRSRMLSGTGAPAPSAVAFTISPATLGNAYSLLPATFRFGGPPAGAAEYLLAINSTLIGGDVENRVFAWRFHTDFVTPDNSTLGLGVNHAPNATITVNNFVEAVQNMGNSVTTTDFVPQAGTTAVLDTLGDKLMYPLYYQNLSGIESLWVSHTVNNNQGGTGPTGIRWYQFNVTGGALPAGAAQQQTFTNGGDGLFRWMPSLALDSNGNLSIGYSASSGSANPSIRYAGRLVSDPVNSLAQGEALLIQGAGSQTSSSSRWGDYSATAVDVADGCTFWHTNEYYASTSAAHWSTRIGAFKFPSCGSTTGTSFYTVPPCRVADTRNTVGPSGGPALLANTVRSFPVTGFCGVPSSATAVAVNMAVWFPADGGNLRAFPTGGTAPLASVLNFRTGIARAGNAVVPLGPLGQLSIQCDMPVGSSGSTNFFFDVYGYFQ